MNNKYDETQKQIVISRYLKRHHQRKKQNTTLNKEILERIQIRHRGSDWYI